MSGGAKQKPSRSEVEGGEALPMMAASEGKIEGKMGSLDQHSRRAKPHQEARPAAATL